MLNIKNCPISTECVPNSLKVAVKKPLFKKPNLDPENNFKTIGLYQISHSSQKK
jgi:hypothetical protein